VRPLNRKNLGRLILCGATAVSGCLVDDSADTPMPPATGGAGGAGGMMAGTGGATAGASGTAGNGDVGGSAGAGGSGEIGGSAGTAGTGAEAGSAGMAVCMPNPTPVACGGFVAPVWSEPLAGAVTIIDFATYADDGDWGNAENGELTGGTHLYHGPNDENLMTVVSPTSLRLTGTIAPFGYVGVVFWFDECVDASAFAGVEFAVGGSMGGSVLKAQVQTHADYPVDVADPKGGCSFTDCRDRFSECSGPVHELVVPPRPETLSLPWSAFSDGVPVNDVTPEGLLGLQYQLECQADTACEFNVTLSNVSFISSSN
jgi:hypothetical protein